MERRGPVETDVGRMLRALAGLRLALILALLVGFAAVGPLCACLILVALRGAGS